MLGPRSGREVWGLGGGRLCRGRRGGGCVVALWGCGLGMSKWWSFLEIEDVFKKI